jgi:hypothetical protein
VALEDVKGGELSVSFQDGSLKQSIDLCNRIVRLDGRKNGNVRVERDMHVNEPSSCTLSLHPYNNYTHIMPGN